MSRSRRALRTDGEATYNRILEAAGELFAANGFAETSNKAIATHAGVDLASINYHFGSRGGLYDTVLIEAHRRLISVESLQQLASADLSARVKLRKLIEGLVECATIDGAWHASVLAREILSPSSHLKTLQESAVPTKLPIILNVLSEITSFPPGDPALLRCAMSVLAPCALLLVVGRNIPAPFADDIRSMPRDALVEHLYDFAVGGLDAIRAKPRC